MREYVLLLTRWQEDQARADRRAQLVVWALAEINRDRKAKADPFTLEDFPLHQWSLVAPLKAHEQPPPSEQLSPEATQAWSEITQLRAMTAAWYGAEAAELQPKGKRRKATKPRQT